MYSIHRNQSLIDNMHSLFQSVLDKTTLHSYNYTHKCTCIDDVKYYEAKLITWQK